jgi:cytochrome d ubiquinol oxidase subunit II
MTIDLPVLSAAHATLAICFYVLLDGFDLGVGGLLLTVRSEHLRSQMIETIEPTWDANETWLIMAGVTLLGAFPVAYGVLLPALYLPLIIMLAALGCRGVSFEFRGQPGSRIHLWDRAFSWGSTIATLCQGIIVGSALTGIHVENGRFVGSSLDILRPYPIFMGVVLLSGYLTLGASWIVFRAAGPLRDHALRQLRVLIPTFAVLGVLAIAFSTAAQPGIGDRWGSAGSLLMVLVLGFLTMLYLSQRSLGRRSDAAPFVHVVLAFLFGLTGLVVVVYPNIVPFRISLWDAAARGGSQIFLLVGVACVMPVVLAYNAFAYYVFRGKVPPDKP